MTRVMQFGCLAVALCFASGVQAQFLDCDDRPDLCDRPVVSEIQTQDLAQAHDIVVLGDGYTQAEQGRFAADVTRLINELKSLSGAHALVTLDPTLFNYHRVDVTSATGDLADNDLSDTAFGGIARSSESIYYDSTSLLFAAAQNAPDVDTVILLMASDQGAANATTPTAHIAGGHLAMPSGGGAHLLSHELGHAMFYLADEYTVEAGCYPGSELTLSFWPNIAIDPEGRKFARAYSDPATQPAPVEGGLYGKCMYRPQTTCKMRSSSSGWCPVCAHQMRVRLEEKRHHDDREMPFSGLAGISVHEHQVAGTLDLFVNGWDARGVTANEVWIDDTLRWTDPYRPYVWDTSAESSGVHVVTTRAVDSSGKVNVDGIRYEVEVVRDVQAPSISIHTPQPHQVFTDVIPLHATAADDSRMAGWDLYIDGVHVTHYEWFGSIVAQDEIVLDVNTTAHADGQHVLRLVVWDTSDNKAAAEVPVVIQNSPGGSGPDVTILEPAPEATVTGNVAVRATAADQDGIIRVELLVDGNIVAERKKAPYNFVWDSALWPQGQHTLVARAFDGNDEFGFSAPVPVWVSNTAGWSVLFVTGATTPNAAEQLMIDRLNSAHGAAVTVVPARSAKASQADDQQLVILSPAISPGVVATKFKRVKAGVLNLNAQLFNDMAMTGRQWGMQAGIKQRQFRLNIVNPDHPLAAGLRGRAVRVTAKPSAFAWGKPSSGAVIAASIATDANQATSFGYEKASTMVSGFVAPARRTGLFTTEAAINAMKSRSKGWALWDAAVKWTAGR